MIQLHVNGARPLKRERELELERRRYRRCTNQVQLEQMPDIVQEG